MVYLRIKNKKAGNKNELYGVKGAYPYLKYNKKVPVEIVQKTPYFVTLKVLPHMCVLDAFKQSQPYNITVDRMQLEKGELQICIE